MQIQSKSQIPKPDSKPKAPRQMSQIPRFRSFEFSPDFKPSQKTSLIRARIQKRYHVTPIAVDLYDLLSRSLRSRS
ncbi:hypothetical protein EYC84_010403 [Monilinia fructicola]|uniref:Uncharacterized protein n=1 Tax=Monilinia fructicola TaxID=38448 RepID=A0A5M9JHW0_MONFR|nr:hypothetical protein EYC84_010403 [Monilinia fructicola]